MQNVLNSKVDPLSLVRLFFAVHTLSNLFSQVNMRRRAQQSVICFYEVLLHCCLSSNAMLLLMPLKSQNAEGKRSTTMRSIRSNGK